MGTSDFGVLFLDDISLSLQLNIVTNEMSVVYEFK